MLRVFFGDMPDSIYNTAVYFKNTYLDEWLDDEFVQRMIKDVDKGRVLGPRLVETKALGKIPPVDLSGGVKTLMLMWFRPDEVFNASTCGDNCAKWILQIARKRDLTINLHHIMNFGEKPFDIEVLNSGKIVHTMPELALEAANALRPATLEGDES